ncbi:MAG: hypothetical protein JXB13_06275 [Phycisphaerae bacterium]|nr:hypothetical protein [Phycisphaerae bacterium]
MMPVPSHLRGAVRPRDTAIDEAALDAEVVCDCGSRRFDLLFPGETHEYRGQQIPCTAQINDRFFFLVRAHCTACGRDHLLFDKDFHGWDGFVCHNDAQASLPRPPLIPWKCLLCGKTEHEASVQIQTQGRADFVEGTEGEFDEERWPDGFEWFSMSITCTGCGKHTPEWVSYETM